MSLFKIIERFEFRKIFKKKSQPNTILNTDFKLMDGESVYSQKFNTNYIKNSEKNQKKIDRIVEYIIKEETNAHPFDFLFRSNSEAYPEATHIVLEIPGFFKQTESANIYTKEGRSLQTDFVETTLPDEEQITRESTTLIEHQSYALTDEKIETIYDYRIFLIGKFKRPCYVYVATNLDYYGKEILIRIDNDPLLIQIISFDKEKIYKILSNLKQRQYNNEKMSEIDFLKLIYCITFAKEPYAKDVIKKSVTLFASIENIEHQHQLDLHLALKIMIKYHFGDENQIRELLEMITKSVTETMIDKIPRYEKLNKENLDYKNTIVEMGKTITEKDKEITEKDQKINEKDKEIKKLKEKIDLLEKNR